MFGNILAVLNLHAGINLVISFICLVFASWCVGEGGEILGDKYDASIIGGLLIAWLNTAPETIFFVTALESKNPEFAVGAVSGSSVVVSTVALGACIYFGTKNRRDKSFYLQFGVKRQCLMLVVSTLIPVLLCFFGFSIVFTLLGSGAYLAFLVAEITKTKEIHDHSKVDIETAEESSSGHDQPLWKGISYLVCGAVLIFIFSEPFIEAVVDLARLAKVNSILLAFFLAPIASEMPEILESISLSRKGHKQSINVAVSNLMGGTITKTTLLTGIFSYYGDRMGFAWSSPNYELSLILLAACAGIAGGVGYFFKTQVPWHSYLLLGTFLLSGSLQYYFNATPDVKTIELDRIPPPITTL
jgi:Ca2+/Na+ antiporter